MTRIDGADVIVDIGVDCHYEAVDVVRSGAPVEVVARDHEKAARAVPGNVVRSGADHERHTCRIDRETERHRTGKRKRESSEQIPTRFAELDPQAKPVCRHALDVGEEVGSRGAHCRVQDAPEGPSEVAGRERRAVADAKPTANGEGIGSAVARDFRKTRGGIRKYGVPLGRGRVREAHQSRARSVLDRPREGVGAERGVERVDIRHRRDTKRAPTGSVRAESALDA